MDVKPEASGQEPPDPALAALLGEPAPSVWHRLRRPLIIGGVILAALVVGLVVFNSLQAPKDGGYVTEPVRRGNLVLSVSATGTLQPVNTVSVGSEQSGTVAVVLADDNDQVRKGQVLARLDTARLDDQVALSLASLASAQASLRQAQATLQEADLAHNRNLTLAANTQGTYPAKATLDASLATLDRARATVGAAAAAVSQAEAGLRTSRTNLAKATIRSPIDGVVLSRSVEPGQTVAASLQAPVLFILAEDISRMELQVYIDEADVGQTRKGQPATFTVDAFPDREYEAALTRVGLGSLTTDGVVTYTGVLTVDNGDLSLRPGMTATAEIITDSRTDVLQVPAAALRYTPADSAPAKSSGGILSSLMPRMPRQARTANAGTEGPRQVWVLQDGEPVALPVTVGVSDGQWTEVSGPGLKAGLAVITDVVQVE